MNSKFFVPFETAKQLKENGYNGTVDYYYMANGQMCFDAMEVSNDTLDLKNNGTIAAPTYHEVIDWLEGKGIYIYGYPPMRMIDVGNYTSGLYDSNKEYWTTCKSVYSTREEALNAAILKALEMI